MTVGMLVVVRAHRGREEMQGAIKLRAARWHAPNPAHIRQHMSAYVSIRQHTSAYVSIRQQTSAYKCSKCHTLLLA